MSGYTLPCFAAAIVLGAVLASPLPSDARVTALCVAAGLCIAIVRNEPRHIRVLLGVALVFSAAYTTISTELEPKINATRTERFSGTVLGVRETGSDLYQYQVKLDGAFVVLVSTNRAVQVGAHIVVRGRLEPFDEPRNPGEPSQRAIERENGVLARIESATILSETLPAPRFGDALVRAKAWALDELRARLGDAPASIVAGELWGERAALPPDLRAEFQETGTVHILVTAGLHVGLAALAIVALCGALGVQRTWSCAIAIACVVLFAGMSGFHIPALRAATMASVALIARALGRKSLSWNALGVAAIVVVAIGPADVTSASFWLSFCCVAAIFALVPALERCLGSITMPQRIREALILTLATQIGTWPITAAVFLQFSTYAILANLAVVPCVPVTMTLGVAQLATAWCSPLAQMFANLNSWVIAWMLGAVRTLAAAPSASLIMTPAPVWAIALYEGSLVPCVAMLRRGGATPAAALIVVATSFVLAPPRLDTHQLRITVLDVGQADAIVIETPAHHAILVDAGGRLERGMAGSDSQAEQIGQRIVVPFLLRAGIHQLDAIVLSHPHGDHVGGCAPVLRKIRVAEIADSGQTYGGHAYHECLDVAHAYHVRVVYPRAGDEWHTYDGVSFKFVGPSLPFIGGKNAINDNSIAFILQYRSFRMLFTGDAGVAAERRFLESRIDLRAELLKVGHHGSAYSSSSEFIKAVHPQYATISVGRHNLFGHPAPSTVEALERAGAMLYRTDQNAAVTVVTRGADAHITTMP